MRGGGWYSTTNSRARGRYSGDTERHQPAAKARCLQGSVRRSPAYASPVEGAPETGRWVALPILGGVLLGLTVAVCSSVAASSPRLAGTVLILTLGLVVLVWLMGHLLTKQDDA